MYYWTTMHSAPSTSPTTSDCYNHHLLRSKPFSIQKLPQPPAPTSPTANKHHHPTTIPNTQASAFHCQPELQHKLQLYFFHKVSCFLSSILHSTPSTASKPHCINPNTSTFHHFTTNNQTQFVTPTTSRIQQTEPHNTSQTKQRLQLLPSTTSTSLLTITNLQTIKH